MPDPIDSDDPTWNPDGDPPPPAPVELAIEQRIVALESNSHTHAAQENSTKEMKREFRLVEIFTIATNIILAIVGIFALRAYYGQLGAMQGQLVEMRHTNELTKRALDGNDKALGQTLGKMQGQIDVADKANGISKAQFQKDQRPYVGQTSKSNHSPSFYSNPQKPGTGQAIWEWHMSDYGKTPAYNLGFKEEIRLGDGAFLPSHTTPGNRAVEGGFFCPETMIFTPSFRNLSLRKTSINTWRWIKELQSVLGIFT